MDNVPIFDDVVLSFLLAALHQLVLESRVLDKRVCVDHLRADEPFRSNVCLRALRKIVSTSTPTAKWQSTSRLRLPTTVCSAGRSTRASTCSRSTWNECTACSSGTFRLTQRRLPLKQKMHDRRAKALL